MRAARGRAPISPSIVSPRLIGGITQAESPECTPASSTCCMTPATTQVSPSQSASTSTSIASSRKRSSSSGCSWSALTWRSQVVGELVGRVADLHRAPAEHVRGPNQEREADVLGDQRRLLGRVRGPVGRVGDLQPAQQGAEAAAVLGQVDRVDGRPQERHARVLKRLRQAQRRLAAELDDHALGLLDLEHREHVLGGQRLEVEAVRRVVVGRDRLRVAVDHHRVAARLAHGHRRMHAAVVELDPLADPVRPGAEDHDRGAVTAADFAGQRARSLAAHRSAPLVCGVVVRGAGLELGCAGVHGAEGAAQLVRAVALDGERLELAEEPWIDHVRSWTS